MGTYPNNKGFYKKKKKKKEEKEKYFKKKNFTTYALWYIFGHKHFTFYPHINLKFI